MTRSNAMAYLNSLPRKRMGSGVLFVNATGHVLVVKPTYKADWEIPGGVVEANESPRRTAAREIVEELGLVVDEETLQPLAVDYLHPSESRTEALMFVFYGGQLTAEDASTIRLSEDEISEYRFAPLEIAVELLGPVVGPRIARCMNALEENLFVYFEDH